MYFTVNCYTPCPILSYIAQTVIRPILFDQWEIHWVMVDMGGFSVKAFIICLSTLSLNLPPRLLQMSRPTLRAQDL